LEVRVRIRAGPGAQLTERRVGRPDIVQVYEHASGRQSAQNLCEELAYAVGSTDVMDRPGRNHGVERAAHSFDPISIREVSLNAFGAASESREASICTGQHRG